MCVVEHLQFDCVCTYECAYVCVCVRVYIRVCIRVCVYVRVCIRVCVRTRAPTNYRMEVKRRSEYVSVIISKS